MRKLFHNRSLRFRLLLALSLVSFLVWLVVMAFQWRKITEEVNTLFDTQQVMFAERLASADIFHGGFHPMHEGRRKRPYDKHIDDDALAFAVFSERGDMLLNDNRKGLTIPFNPKRGFDNVAIQDDNERDVWRIFWLKKRDTYIAVGQEMEYREELISKLVSVQLGGWFVGLPLLLIAISLILSHELKSLTRLKREVMTRKPDEAKRLDIADLPQEIVPLVKSLNNYFDRTQTMFNRERRFTSDAAHELRSPLAGLRVQAELAELTMDDPSAHRGALKNITTSIDRIALLIEQLLTLSRLDNLVELDEVEKIDWQKLIESNVIQLYSQAEQKQSEIEVKIDSLPANLQGKSILLSLMLRNLLENAIKYTPNGSLIRLQLSEKTLIVEDNGNGVSEDDLAKLGQPFYRPVDRPDTDSNGSGLGISIIKRIAELHRFELKMSKSSLGGLKTELFF